MRPATLGVFQGIFSSFDLRIWPMTDSFNSDTMPHIWILPERAIALFFNLRKQICLLLPCQGGEKGQILDVTSAFPQVQMLFIFIFFIFWRCFLRRINSASFICCIFHLHSFLKFYFIEVWLSYNVVWVSTVAKCFSYKDIYIYILFHILRLWYIIGHWV